MKRGLTWIRAGVNLLFGLAIPASFWLVSVVGMLTPTLLSLFAPPLLVVVAWIMRKWAWIPLRFLVGGKPWLQGTYLVTIKSDYEGASRHENRRAIRAYASIRQDAWGEVVTLATKTTSSRALDASLRPSGDHFQLLYSYTTSPPQEDLDSNPVQLGTAALDILERGRGTIRGRYFTDQKTGGNMSWQRIGHRAFADFEEAEDYAKRKKAHRESTSK